MVRTPARPIAIRPARRRGAALCALLSLAFAALATLAWASPAAARPLVVIDPGHGGLYNHARYGSLLEKQANLLFSLELGRQLYAAGYDVEFTRTIDTALTYGDIPAWRWVSPSWTYAPDGIAWYSDGVPRDDLQARCDVANDLGADVFISIHCNGASSSSAHGTENWASTHDALGTQLGRFVQTAVLEQTGQRDRGAGQMDFYVVRWTNMPALLIETGFMSNPTEGALIANASWRQRYVRGIVNGLNRWMATDPMRAIHARAAGATRSEAAVIASQMRWPEGAPAVLLAWPDDIGSALSAPLAASTLSAPLLYADVRGLSDATRAEIARLGPQRIVVFGTQLPEQLAIEAASAAGLDASAIERIAGAEPVSAAAVLAERLASADTTLTVVLASTEPASDALAGATLAASRRDAVLLLTRADGSLPDEAAAFIDGHRERIGAVYLIGSVSDESVLDVPGGRLRIGPAAPIHTFSATVAAARPAGDLWLYCYNPNVQMDTLTAMTAAASRPGGAPVPIAGKRLSPYTREWLENNGHRVRAITMVGTLTDLPSLADHFVMKAIY